MKFIDTDLNRIAASLIFALLVNFVSAGPVLCGVQEVRVSPQPAKPDQLANGGFEQIENGRPVGWRIVDPGDNGNFQFSSVEDEKFNGQYSLRIDATENQSTGNPNAGASFGNAMQSLDPSPWRGKRLRFRAAVKTTDLSDDGRAQLWMRVDRKPSVEGGHPNIGFFDNMDERPIRSDDWKHYEIIGDVADDAQSISIGILVLGQGKVWVDDASFEEVSSETTVTGNRGVGGEMNYEPQPFWNWWLILPAIAIFLMVWGQLKDGALARFAFRFSFCYWLLYFFPAPFSTVALGYGYQFSNWYQNSVIDPAVRWTASNVMGIGWTLIPPGGSGDSTFSHIQLLMTFVLAIVFGLLWSAAGKLMRQPSHSYVNQKDWLRSYVRYTLAFIVLGYGIAKLVSEGGQFRAPGVDQLEKTWGNSSPMNVLWTFMGYSWYYTFFGGLAEVIGGVLMVWRRTMLLGALMTFSVMLNIVMMNFCYDVPVKLYSSHLCFAALYVLLPDLSRLMNLLILNRSVESAVLRPAWSLGWKRAIHLTVKIWLVGIGIFFPLTMFGYMEYQRATGRTAKMPLEGEFRVADFQSVHPESEPKNAVGWRSLYLSKIPGQMGDEWKAYCVVRLVDHNRLNAQATISKDQQTITFSSFDQKPQGELSIKSLSPDEFEMTGQAFGQNVVIRLQRAGSEEYLLMRRGFRWINEYPFNR